MRYIPWLLIGFISIASAAAPVTDLTDQQRLERLERRVDKITELTLQLDGLKQENLKLRGSVETLHHQIEQLKRKQRDIYLDIDQRITALGGSANPPAPQPSPTMPPKADAVAPGDGTQSTPQPSNTAEQAKADYDAAYALLSPAQRRYKEAIQAFSGFLQKYPNSKLAGNAQYWLGEAHYVSQNNKAALRAFDKVVNDYPQSAKVPGALYKIGRIHQVKGDLQAARASLQRIVQDYPNSSAAGLARERLLELNRSQ